MYGVQIFSFIYNTDIYRFNNDLKTTIYSLYKPIAYTNYHSSRISLMNHNIMRF